ncbi:hypothetical protein QCI44_28760 [Bacillus cereus group sp. RP37]|uniref:hypothetical protein n=1 Tax=Bacillus cereus group sp. RP37 TaxID=3040259 RepID=UPI00339969B7
MRVMRIVNSIPVELSDETNNDAEPSIAVNPINPDEMVITAFTPSGFIGSLFFSTDGGENWSQALDIPDGMPQDITPAYSSSGQLYLAFVNGASGENDFLNVARTTDFNTMAQIIDPDPHPKADMPWVVATTVFGGPDNGKDRLYVGYNSKPPSGKSATVYICQDANAANPQFSKPLTLDSRNPVPSDSWEIRPTVHPDGTVYIAYKRRIDVSGDLEFADIVVVRDDHWGDSGTPFTALTDSSDGLAGKIVVHSAEIWTNNYQPFFGYRLGANLNIAVDPTNSSIVYIAWLDGRPRHNTLRVRKSVDRGVTWSNDLLVVSDADVLIVTMVVNNKGKVGLTYQQLVNNKVETHFRTTVDGINWDDTLLARTDTPDRPSVLSAGDYMRMDTVGEDFYGVFPAMNTPDPANFFPNGGGTFRYQRNTQGTSLVGSDGVAGIRPSVDPFFFKIQEIDDCFKASHLEALSRFPDNLDVFWIGPEGAVWSNWWGKYFNNGKLNTPFKVSDPLDPKREPKDRPVPASLNSPVSVVLMQDPYVSPGHRMDVFWIGIDGAIWWSWWNEDITFFSLPRKIFNPYDSNLDQPVKARLNSPITALSRTANWIDIFWIGEDDAIWTIGFNGNYMTELDQPNPVPRKISGSVKVSKSSPLQAFARFEDILNVFWVGQDGQVWSTWWGQSFNNGNWNPPSTISDQGSPYGGNL